MRKNARVTTLSLLREITGLGQKKFAEMVGTSVHTIKALEQERLKMSRDFAMRVATFTGIDPDWLLAGEIAHPPRPALSEGGAKYTAETFNSIQRFRKLSLMRGPTLLTPVDEDVVSAFANIVALESAITVWSCAMNVRRDPEKLNNLLTDSFFSSVAMAKKYDSTEIFPLDGKGVLARAFKEALQQFDEAFKQLKEKSSGNEEDYAVQLAKKVDAMKHALERFDLANMSLFRERDAKKL